MRRVLSFGLLLVLGHAASGCEFFVSFDDSLIPKEDVGSVDGTTDVPVEDATDTGTPDDTFTPEDTADTAPVDSSSTDSADATDATDSADASDSADTFVADTFVPDTFVPDTFVPDTFVPDTFVPDTFVADTATTDSADGGDADAAGDADAETCVPLTCASLGLTCGSISDGCGLTLNCNDGSKNGGETDIDCGGTGTCARCAAGKVCSANGDCASNHCVDGVCCDTACTGQCEACNQTGSVGTCSQVVGAPVGGRGACTGSGTCAGACAAGNRTTCTYPTTSCRAASCASGTLTAAANCDGAGACPSASTSSCGAYLCGSSTACATTCSTSLDCSAGNTCVGSSCVATKTNGQNCGIDSECSSGHCVDGVCCDTTCTGLCQACSALKKGAGASGTCGSIAVGTDPDDECADQGAASCGTTGSCNGAGACALYAGGTSCAAATCTSGSATTARTCNGTGTCSTGTTTSCSPYVCNGGATACLSSCADDTSCATGFYCNGSSTCVAKKSNGDVCSAGTQCTSGNCVDGVCCNTACSGTCVTCNQTGTVGTCTNTTSGLTDTGTCTAPYKCNGSAACIECFSGSECTSKVCTGNVCQAPACNDGVKNGDELGVDCGGTCPNACASLLAIGASSSSAFGAVYDLAGDTWTPTSIGAGTTSGLDLAILADGTGIGVMRFVSSGDPNDNQLQYTKFAPATATWTTFAAVGTATTRSAPSVAATTMVAHIAYQDPGDYSFKYAAFSGGTLSPTAEAIGWYGPSAGAIAALGASAAFTGYNGGASNDLYRADRGSSWGSSTSIASGSDYDTQPAVITLTTGNLMVIFRGGDAKLYWTRGGGTTWTSPAAIPSATSPATPGLAPLASGGAVVTFRGDDGNLYASFFDGSAWGSVGKVTDTVTGIPSVTRGLGTATAEIVFVNTEDSQAYHTRYVSSAWTTPKSIGGTSLVSVTTASLQ